MLGWLQSIINFLFIEVKIYRELDTSAVILKNNRDPSFFDPKEINSHCTLEGVDLVDLGKKAKEKLQLKEWVIGKCRGSESEYYLYYKSRNHKDIITYQIKVNPDCFKYNRKIFLNIKSLLTYIEKQSALFQDPLLGNYESLEDFQHKTQYTQREYNCFGSIDYKEFYLRIDGRFLKFEIDDGCYILGSFRYSNLSQMVEKAYASITSLEKNIREHAIFKKGTCEEIEISKVYLSELKFKSFSDFCIAIFFGKGRWFSKSISFTAE